MKQLNVIFGIMSVVLTLALPARAMDSAERMFMWNEANALMSTAQTPSDFLAAARSYQKMLDAGVRNGPLFYNMGTALLKAEQYDLAITLLLRAERYLGTQPDITHNLNIALTRNAKSATPEWPWYRIPLTWHYYFATSTRALITASAFVLFWLALLLRRGGWRHTAGILLVVALTGFVTYGSSTAASCYQETTAKRIVLPMKIMPAKIGN